MFIHFQIPSDPLSYHLTSVTASKEAECLSSRSMDRMWFFLQAIWRGVKPFWRHRENSSQLDYTYVQSRGLLSSSFLLYTEGSDYTVIVSEINFIEIYRVILISHLTAQ